MKTQNLHQVAIEINKKALDKYLQLNKNLTLENWEKTKNRGK